MGVPTRPTTPPPRRPLVPCLLFLLAVLPCLAGAYHHRPPAGPRHGLLGRGDALQRAVAAGAAAAAVGGGLSPQPSLAAPGLPETVAPPAAGPPPPGTGSKLWDRFFTDDLSNPGLAGFNAPKVLFLPPFLFGSWNATMRFSSYTWPLGERFVPPQVLRSVKGVELQAPTSFPLRFYSTIPDTTENTLRVTLGEVPTSEIVPDRTYNTRAVLDAYYGYPACGEISYDLAKNPLRMDITFATMGPDLRPLPARRQQLLFNNLKGELVRPDLFVCSEYVRTVTLGPGRSVSVTDSETLSEYEVKEDGDLVEGRQRVALFLTPNPNSAEGALFFETNNKAIGIFDYSFQMRRAGNCVTTPKGIDQCVSLAGDAAYIPSRNEDDDGSTS